MTARVAELGGDVVEIEVERDAAGAVLVADVDTADGQGGRVWLRLAGRDVDLVARRLTLPYTGWDVETGVLSDDQLTPVRARAAALRRVPAGDSDGWAAAASSAVLDLPVLLADADASRWLLRQVREQHAALMVAALESLAAAAAGEADPLACLREVLADQGQYRVGAAPVEASPAAVKPQLVAGTPGDGKVPALLVQQLLTAADVASPPG